MGDMRRSVSELFGSLNAEHRRIKAVTEALDAFVSEPAGLDPHEVIRFATFFRGYVDGLHHQREELVLLPALGYAGFAPDSGALAHIVDQHRKEARLLLAFVMAASAKAPWGAGEKEAIAAAARALAAFQRSHMGEEQELLFPLAQRELAVDHAEAVLEELERFDRRTASRYNPEWLEQLGDELVAAHPVT
ncbi:MAG TPA: hemerythrin domain-containing protein [Polyangiaceae bacterium]